MQITESPFLAIDPPPPPQESTFQRWLHIWILFLGNGEWLFHVDDTTVRNYDIFERLVAAIRLCTFNLGHHILKDQRIVSIKY